MSWPGQYSVACPVYGSTPRVESGRDPLHRRAGIDAAKTTDENRKHWNSVDNFAPVSQLTPAVRQILRNRSRYEFINNSFYTGAVRTLINDTVGRGPRLRMTTDDDKFNANIDSLWKDWASASDWGLNCRVMIGVDIVAGDCPALYYDSKRLDKLGIPVTLALKLYEPDQMAHKISDPPDRYSDDGVDCDSNGEPIRYRFLRVHPGDQRTPTFQMLDDPYEPVDVLHWFVPTRPGQLRGYPLFTSALGVFAQLRRFTMATLSSAEIAAMLAGVMQSGLPWDGSNPMVDQERWFDTVELVRGSLISLPPGVTASQFKPEQPTTNYQMFVSAKLREISRCSGIPFGKIAGDYSQYNYSSSKAEDAPYWCDREVIRDAFESKVCNPFLYRWFDFARFAIPQLAAFRGKWWQLPHVWEYDARPTSDAVKDATADELNLTNGSDSLDAIASRDGTTVDRLIADRKRTKEKFEAAGLPLPPWLAGSPAPARSGDGVPANLGTAQ